MKISSNKILIGLIIYGLILCFSVWYLFFYFQEDDLLFVDFLKVGQGDAILITTLDKTKILVDTGPLASSLNKALGEELPVYDKKIDLVILTHGDTDHSGGLPMILENFNVGMLVTASTTNLGELHETIISTAFKNAVPIKYVTAGDQIITGSVVIDFLWPTKHNATSTNDTSVIFKLTYEENSFLFTGDASEAVELEMVNLYENLLDVDVLKVGHHGSKTSTNNLFLELVSPEFSILSFGSDNRYGHPHPEVVERLENVSSKIIRTDDSTQTLISNGVEVSEWY